VRKSNEYEEVSGKQPGFYLYPADLDRELAVLPVQAQAIWVRMLCHMHWSPRRGFLQHTTGAGWTNADIARMMGMPEGAVDRLLYLMENTYGTFSRDANGIIFNRRMVRDSNLTAIRRASGKLGGNPNWISKTTSKNAPEDILLANLVEQTHKQNTTLSSSTSSSISESELASDAAIVRAGARARERETRAGTHARHPSEPDSAKSTSSSDKCGYQSVDWPETDSAITDAFPATDDVLRQEIVACGQKAWAGAAQPLTDAELARAIVQATDAEQRSARLYLLSVPRVLGNKLRQQQRKGVGQQRTQLRVLTPEEIAEMEETERKIRA